MAIVFTIISMLLTCGEDLFEKKSISDKTDDALKTLVWYGIFNALLFCVVMLFASDEMTVMPYELIFKKPAVLLAPVIITFCLFFSLLAYKYVGVSVRNTFVNTEGLFFIIIMVIYHLLTGNAQHVTRLFTPHVIFGLVLLIGAGFIYPLIKDSKKGETKTEESKDKALDLSKNAKKVLILGIFMAIISGFFDGSEAAVSSVLLGDDVVDSTEYIGMLSLVSSIISVFVFIYLSVKEKAVYNPFRKTEKNRCISQFLRLASDFCYVYAISEDAILGVILWSAFPVLDIIGARIFMKEKLRDVQYLVLLIMIVGAVLISLS